MAEIVKTRAPGHAIVQIRDDTHADAVFARFGDDRLYDGAMRSTDDDLIDKMGPAQSGKIGNGAENALAGLVLAFRTEVLVGGGGGGKQAEHNEAKLAL